jgi:hypothetical protein
VAGRGHGLILRYYPSNCLEGLRKTTKTSVRIAGPPKYKAVNLQNFNAAI